MSVNELIHKLILETIFVSQGMMLCKVMYKDLLSEESYQWISLEIDHYDDPEYLPDYRIVDCEIKVQTNGYWGSKTEVLDTSPILRLIKESVKPYVSPNKMLIRQGIESIEKMMRSSGSSIVMPLGREQVDMLMKYYTCAPGYRIESMYQEAHVEYLNNIISRVRNRLISILQTEVLSKQRDNESPKETSGKKTVFISYGWDDDAHKAWVRRLAGRLADLFEVRIDEKLPLGADLNSFMEHMVSSSDRVLLILTPEYKEKADARINGVGYESVLISSELYHNQGTTKFIPILRKGDFKDAYPNYLGNRKGLDMTRDESFSEKFNELVDDITNN